VSLVKNADYFPAKHGNPPPDVADRDVIMVDFSYKRALMEDIIQECRSIIVLDHHKTAQAELEGLSAPNAEIVFDMNRSGAMLAWDHFGGGNPAPPIVRYMQDRDLWRHELPKTREIASYLFSFPYTFGHYDACDKQLREQFDLCVTEGAAILRSTDRQIEGLIAESLREMTIAGHTVPAININYVFASDAANKIVASTGAPFAAAYSDDATCRRFSLRSIGDFDVSAIAQRYGGGGHRNAAGFQAAHGWDGDAAA